MCIRGKRLLLMKIIDLLKNEKVCISCELFPPKAGTELQNALNIVSDIAEVGPHFMSVTYGAGGTSVGQTVAIARAIEASGRPALAHLTCIDADEAKIDGVLAQMRAAGVQNVLALRGDAVNGNDGDFAHASDLMGKIKKPVSFVSAGPVIRKDIRKPALWIVILSIPDGKSTVAATF